MKTLIRRLLFSFAVVAFAVAPARAVSPVVWSLTVPPPTTQSTSSALGSVTSDAAGDAFIVINLTYTTLAGGVPFAAPVGSQLFLLNPKGKIVGSTEVSAVIVVPLYVTARRVVAIAGGSLVEYKANADGGLTATPLSTQTAGEMLVPSEPLNQNFKYLHTTLSTNGFISTVKRYLVNRLAP